MNTDKYKKTLGNKHKTLTFHIHNEQNNNMYVL